jgi:hypothetical protein
MKNKDKQDIEDGSEAQDDAMEGSLSSRSFLEDQQLSQTKNYPSDVTPQDMYQYKKMRINPNADTDFSGLIDKDFTLANMGGEKPNLQEKRFAVGTYNLVKSVFVNDVFFADKNGFLAVDAFGTPLSQKVFDNEFEPVLTFLLGDIKSELAGSRALGSQREAVLDITTNLKKSVDKRRDDNNRSYGLG